MSATLRMGSSLVAAFCETVVPAVEGEPTALMGVSAADLGVPERLGPEAEQVLADVLGPDFASLGIAERTARLNDRVAAGDAAAYELRRLRAQVVALSYGLTTEGRNPPSGQRSATQDRSRSHRHPRSGPSRSPYSILGITRSSRRTPA